MAAREQLPEVTKEGAGKLVLLTLAGAAAAAWVWNRQGEDALRARTEARLRSLGGGGEA